MQRVSYILLINAGTSLQQIHKLSKCDLAFSISWYFKSKYHSNTQVCRIQKNHLPSLLFLAVFSQNNFIFQKMLHLVEITDVTAFSVCLSVSPGLFLVSFTLCADHSGITLQAFGLTCMILYCLNEFLFMFPMFSFIQPQFIILSYPQTINHKSIVHTNDNK